MNAHKFFKTIYPEFEDANLLIWELDNKKSSWFTDLKKAADYVAIHDTNVYFGVGLSPDPNTIGNPKTPIAKKRCLAHEIIGIPGLWADIDIQGPAHGKSNLPKTHEEAMSIIKGHGTDPSLIINSGHGLQAYWLFKEFWQFDSDEERNKAALLQQRLIETLQQRAIKNNWSVDSVTDLARVFRIPGTWNIKSEQKKNASAAS